MQFYNTKEIRKRNADFNYIVGERSNGKTTAVLRDIIEEWYQTGRKGAIVRQMDEDIKGHKGASLFAGAVAEGMVAELTDDEYQKIVFRNRAYYMVKVDPDTHLETVNKEPFAHIFAVSQAIHYKSNSYPNVGTIMFDEFMRSDHVYLVDEVVQFLNLVSTIVRYSEHVKVFLIANTVSWNSPYFTKFGLRDISKMSPGDLAEFDYRSTRTDGSEVTAKVAVEYCRSSAEYGGKPSDKYFIVVQDPRVLMITDGGFAIPTYPRCPHAFSRENVLLTYWIETENGVIRSRLMRVDRDLFFFNDRVPQDVYERRRDDRRDVFYSLDFSAKYNHFISPLRHYADERTHLIADAFAANRMFFENNEVGEDLIYYTMEADKKSILTL